LRPLSLAAFRLLPLLVLLPAPLAGAAGPLTWLEAHFHAPASFDGLASATDVEPSPDGRFVYVAGRTDDAVSWFARDATTGALTYGGRLLGDSQAGGTAPDFDRPFALAASPDGAHLYVIASNSNALVLLERDADTGALAFRASYADTASGGDPQQPLTLLRLPRAVAVRPDGACVAAGSFDDSTDFDEAAVVAFARDPASGALTPADAEIEGLGGVDALLRVRGLAWDPSGTHLYAASVGSAGIAAEPASVSVFEPDDAPEAPPCALRFVESQKEGAGGVSGIGNARDVAVSPDGAHVYVAGGGDNVVAGGLGVFARDPQTGGLTFLEARTAAEIGAEQPNGVAVTPDGAHVLVVAQGTSGLFDSRLAVYGRDPATGLLTPLVGFADGAGGVDGLRGAFGVAVAPDGGHAFVASEKDFAPDDPNGGAAGTGALAVFRVPEPAAGGAALAALAALASRRRARGRRLPRG
jgi:6-phosphogluconolactonase (cycloisomerase 2 family)